MFERIEICWASDSSGKTTCHLNTGGTLVDTYIGEIIFKEGKWYSLLKDDPTLYGPHLNYKMAKLHVEDFVDGEEVHG